MRYDIKFSGHAIILPSGEAIDAEWSDGALFDQVRDGLYALEISPNIIEQAAGHIISFGRNIIKPNAHITPVKSTIDNRLIQMVPIGEGRTAAAGQVSYIHSPRWRGHKRGIQIPDYAFTRLKAFADLAHKTRLILKIERGNLAPWMKTAWGELGVTENKSETEHNPRILQYYREIGQSGIKNDQKTPWCGTFVAWVMTQNGHSFANVPALKINPLGAKNWAGFGRSISEPTYGCIAIKKRTGGGHVTFIVGQSYKGDTLYGLGGNQGDKVQVTPFPKSVFTDFQLPSNYDNRLDYLPHYKGKDSGSVSET